MAKLLDIEGRWIDPNKVISVVWAPNSLEVFHVHVDMNNHVATYVFDADPEDGWTVDLVGELVNEERD